MQQVFGAGNMYGLVLSGGVYVPQKFGTLQDVSIDYSFESKMLYGQNQFPVAIARGKGKITGKAKFANLQGAVLNNIIFGQTAAAGQTLFALAEAGTVPATTPWHVTTANAATFVDDLGVTYAATGLPFTRVASGPTIGQYSEAAGIYTFATADASAGVLIDYTYTTAAVGSTITLSNQLLGVAPVFQVVLPYKYNGKTYLTKFNNALSSKLSMATKLDDFMIPEFDMDFAADASGMLGYISLSDA